MSYFFLFQLLLIIETSFVEPVQISEWRGTDRTGIYNESGLLEKWPDEGPRELWTVDNTGDGFVSPVFNSGKFYITGMTDSSLFLQCYDLNGLKVWQTMLGKEWKRSYPGSRSATTIAGDLIYTGSGFGNLYCIDKNSGQLIWSKDLLKDFDGQLPLHGHSEAALIDGNKVFWTAGGKENNVVALNRFTGEIIWADKGFGEASGYNSPKLIKLNNRNIVVTFSSYHLMGFDSETGKLLWSHEQDNTPIEKRSPGIGDTHSNTILYDSGSIYYAAGDGNCGVKLDLSEDGNTITEKWRNTHFDSFMGGIVKIGKYIYGCGTARPGLYSISAETGKIIDSLSVGTGAIITADNMIYYYNQKGEMNLVACNEGDLELISTFRIKKGTSQHFAHPVINGGVLYQRHGKVLIAYDIKKDRYGNN